MFKMKFSTQIPFLAWAWLDEFEHDCDEWKEDFYPRYISNHVKLNIETFDFPRLIGLPLAQNLKNWIENPSDGSELAALLKNFEQLMPHLPEKIKERCDERAIKSKIKKAYKKLIILAVLHYMDSIALDNSQEAKKIKRWIATQKKGLTRYPFQTWLHGISSTIFNIYQAFNLKESSFWLSYKLPFLLKLEYKILKNTFRRFWNNGTLGKNFASLFIGAVFCMFIPLFMLYGGAFFLLLNLSNRLAKHLKFGQVITIIAPFFLSVASLFCMQHYPIPIMLASGGCMVLGLGLYVLAGIAAMVLWLIEKLCHLINSKINFREQTAWIKFGLTLDAIFKCLLPVTHYRESIEEAFAQVLEKKLSPTEQGAQNELAEQLKYALNVEKQNDVQEPLQGTFSNAQIRLGARTLSDYIPPPTEPTFQMREKNNFGLT